MATGTPAQNMSEITQHPYRWVVLFMAFVVGFIPVSFLWLSVPVILPTISADLNINSGEIEVIYSTISFGLIFSIFAGGFLGDRYSVKWVIGIGGLLTGCSGILRWFEPSYGMLIFASIITAVGVGLIFPNIAKILTEWFAPIQLGLAEGGYLVGVFGGGAIAQTISPAVISLVGSWQITFLLYGGLSLICSVIWIFLVHSPSSEEKPITPDSLSHPTDQSHTQSENKDESRFTSLRTIFSLPITYSFIAIGFFLQYLFVGLAGLVPIWATVTSYTVPAVVVGGTLYMAAVGSIIIPSVSDRIGHKSILYILFIGGAVGVIIAVYSASLMLFIIGVVIAGLCIGGLFPVALTIPGRHPDVGAARAGRITGIAIGLGQIGGTISPLVSKIALNQIGIGASGLVLGLPLLLALIPIRSMNLQK